LKRTGTKKKRLESSSGERSKEHLGKVGEVRPGGKREGKIGRIIKFFEKGRGLRRNLRERGTHKKRREKRLDKTRRKKHLGALNGKRHVGMLLFKVIKMP